MKKVLRQLFFEITLLPIKSAQDDSILYHSMIAKILTIKVNNNNKNDNDNSHIKQKVCKSPAFASFFKSSVPLTLQLVFKFM